MNSPNPYAPPKAPVADTYDGDEAALASRGQRLGAAILDALISMIWTIPLGLAFGIWSAAFRHQAVPYGNSLLVTLLGFILFAAVNAHFLRANGQTIGKKLVGIRIVTLDYAVPDLKRILLLRYGTMWGVSIIPGSGGCSASSMFSLFSCAAPLRHHHISATKVARADVATCIQQFVGEAERKRSLKISAGKIS